MKVFEKNMKKQLIGDGSIKRDRDTKLTLREIMSIVVYFQISGYRNFKHYYISYVCTKLKRAFPDLLSYKRFVALKPRIYCKIRDYFSLVIFLGDIINLIDTVFANSIYISLISS